MKRILLSGVGLACAVATIATVSIESASAAPSVVHHIQAPSRTSQLGPQSTYDGGGGGDSGGGCCSDLIGPYPHG